MLLAHHNPIVGVLLLVKQRIDVLNGIAWDNKTARLFGEWILSGYFHDRWVFTLTWPWLGINFTDSACKGRETINNIAFIWSHSLRNFQQLLWIVSLYFWELHGIFPTLALCWFELVISAMRHLWMYKWKAIVKGVWNQGDWSDNQFDVFGGLLLVCSDWKAMAKGVWNQDDWSNK